MSFPDLEHPRFGVLHYSDRYHCYQGQTTVQQVQISVSFATDDAGNLDSRLWDRANDVVTQMESYSEDAKKYAVEGLLELKNENWLDSEEEPLTREQFKHRMTLESVDISVEGEIGFFYDDGDLFFGHCIVITLDQCDRFVNADIAG
jgi:hypothetical protein